MVCSIESGKMMALPRLLDGGSASQTVTGEAGHQKLAAQFLSRELREADEANLLDEEDMHIFGLRPMTDPLDLVCCNACKKPIKASHFAAHAELCKSLSSRVDASLELDGTAVNKKPPRKERKKSLINQTKKAKLLKDPKNFQSVDSEDTAASESHVDKKMQTTAFAEAKGNMCVTLTPKINGSRISPHNMDCSEDATRCSLKALKRTATESQSNPGTKNSVRLLLIFFHLSIRSLDVGVTTVTYKSIVLEEEDVPAPLATKIYYSQSYHHLRRAICHMFFEESSKESSSEVSNLDTLQVNAVPTQMLTPSNSCYDQVKNQQKENHFLHQVQTSDQVLAASSDFNIGKSGGFVPSLNVASQLPVNNTLEPHYLSNSYSFAGKSGNPLVAVQQGSGSVPVV